MCIRDRNQGELEELVSIIDEDLGDLEDDFYEDDDDEAGDVDFDEEYYEVVCPTCGDPICLAAVSYTHLQQK